MAVKSPNKSSTGTKQATLRPVDKYFFQYAQHHQHKINRQIRYFAIPFMLFGLFGLLWAIPFPHLKFLGSYNGYFNWASFLIAFAVYFYSRLSPTLSYVMLLVLLGFSYGVIKLQDWQNAGGPVLWVVCIIVLLASAIAQFAGYKAGGEKYNLKSHITYLLISPIWLLLLIMKRFSLKY